MTNDPNTLGLVAGAVSLAGVRMLIAKGRPTLRSSTLAALAGGTLYPLLLCTFMGLAGARARVDDHAWVRFRHAFATYAQAAPIDSIPRGVVMGIFAVACVDLFGRRTAARSRRLAWSHGGSIIAGEGETLEDARLAASGNGETDPILDPAAPRDRLA